MEKEKKAPDFDYAQSPVHIWLLSAVEAPDFDYAQSPAHCGC
jgi:hypothetical protein